MDALRAGRCHVVSNGPNRRSARSDRQREARFPAARVQRPSRACHTVVYSGAIGRTQVYLGSDDLELLDRVARLTGASRSELVRRAVRSTFGQPTKTDKLEGLAASAGSWRGRELKGSEYVDSVRGDLARRLGRLGLE